MRIKIIVSVSVLLAVGFYSGCTPATSTNLTGQAGHLSNSHFAIALWQNGKKVKIVNNTAVLEKAPFDIVVAFPLPSGLFVNASFKPDLLALARTGASLGKAIPFEGISEDRNNCLTVRDDAWQYWYYRGPGISKFDDVRELSTGQGGESWVCKKILKSYRQTPGQPGSVLKEIQRDRLYLVFAAAPWTTGPGPRRVEQAREYLKIMFIDN